MEANIGIVLGMKRPEELNARWHRTQHHMNITYKKNTWNKKAEKFHKHSSEFQHHWLFSTALL